MFYQLVPAPSAELVLCVNQGARSSKFDRRRGELRPRAVNRRFSQTAMRIERTSEYQLSLGHVLELGQRFQAQLDPAQKEQWLALEDALLEHSSRLNQAYFQAGAEFGRQQSGERGLPQSARLGSHPHRAIAKYKKAAAERARDVEMINALAELIRKLARR